MSARKRALLILLAALLLAGLSWLGAALLANARFALDATAAGGGEGGVRPATALRAATCRRTPCGELPGVRFDRTPREDGATDGPADAPATPLDTADTT